MIWPNEQSVRFGGIDLSLKKRSVGEFDLIARLGKQQCNHEKAGFKIQRRVFKTGCSRLGLKGKYAEDVDNLVQQTAPARTEDADLTDVRSA
jgi:hypothetical protein